MSSNVVPLEVVSQQISELSLNKDKFYAVLKGSSETTFRRFTTNSYNTSAINWSTPPPSEQILVSRHIIQEISFDITITGTTSATNILDGWGLTMGFKALPIANATQNMNLRINDASFSIATNDCIQPFMRYGYHNMQREISSTPNYLDKAQSYSELVNTIRNPLGSSWNSFNSLDEQRGSYPIQILSNTPTSAVIRVTFYEPVMLSPLHFVGKREDSFVGVRSMDWTLTFCSNIGVRIIGQASNDPATITNIAVQLAQQPALLFSYFTPHETQSIPRERVYPFVNVERYITDYGSSVAAGATVQIVSNNVQLNSIPRRMYVFARVQNNSLTVRSTDTFLRLNSVNVSFGNRSGLLSSASVNQLYEMSKLAGCDLSWNEWYGNENAASAPGNRSLSGVGSVLAIDPGYAIGLSSLQAPGLLENSQLQITATFQNISADPMNVSMYIVVLSDGVVSCRSGQFTTQVGILSNVEVLGASQNHEFVEFNQGEGSGFFSELGSIVSKVVPVIRKAIPIVDTVSTVAKAILGNGRKMRKRRGRGLVGGMDGLDEMPDGGELVSRSELREMSY